MELLLRNPCSASASKLCGIREQVREVCAQLGYMDSDIDCIVLAIDEACANIIRHAYKNQKYGKYILEIFRNNEDVIFRLQDFADKVDASCFNAKLEAAEELSKPGGLGLVLIHRVMDSVQLLATPGDEGNLLEMRKKLPEGA